MAENVIRVNGKKVTFREPLPSGDFIQVWRGVQNIPRVGELSIDDQVADLIGIVESWEFEGDPQGLEAWKQLDLFVEFLPLLSAIGDYVNDRVGEAITEAKN